MKIRVIRGGDLGPNEVNRWSELQQANPQFASPYLCPHFTQAVASVRDDTFVGVMEEGRRVVGFFPFQRGRLPTGRPVGGPLSDYQAVISAKDAEWTPDQLVRGCGLATWKFDHLLASQDPFRPCHQVINHSPIMDLSKGYEGYLRQKQQAGHKPFTREHTKQRKLEREVDEVLFETHTDDPEVFKQLLQWKSAQYARTNLIDVFSFEWTVNLLDRIRLTHTQEFAGLLSALRVGGRLIAAHLGMRSGTVWHWWFPAYDPEFANFSPGLILLLKMAEVAKSLGIEVIDLGKGLAPYKQRLKTDAVMLAEGRVVVAPIAGVTSRLCEQTAAWILHNRPPILARIPGLLTRRLQRWNRYR